MNNKTENNVKCVKNDLLWHHRFGHLNRKNMNSISKLANGLNDMSNDISRDLCVICLEGKQTRILFESVPEEQNIHWSKYFVSLYVT